MTRRRQAFFLSAALHGALLTSLVWVDFRRVPEDPPAGMTVVWLDAGLPDLAAASRGDRGIADTAEPDPAGEPEPEAVASVDDSDRPAAPRPDARDPVSGADRPAPTPIELADDNRQRRSEGDASDGDAAPLLAGDAPAEPDPRRAEAVVDPAGAGAPEAAEPAPDAQPAATAGVSAEARREAAIASADAPPDATIAPEEAPSEITSQEAPQRVSNASAEAAPPVPNAPAETSPEAAAAATLEASAGSPGAVASAASSAEPSPALEPVAPAVQERLRDEVMDLLNRSRELPSTASAAWSRDGHEYRAEMTRVLDAGATGIEEALIEITTERNGRHVSTKMRVKRLAFSHYAQFVDRWDPFVQIHDDEIDGRFHANSAIAIENSGGVQPVFHGTVTTTSDIDTSMSSRRVRRNQVFLGGLETRVPRIALPKRFAPLEAIADDAVNIVALESDSLITFFADGRYRIDPIVRGRRRGARPGGAAQRAGVLGASPTYFVAAEKATLEVKGTVNGKVLVYSPTEIVIAGDLVYAADPTRVESSDDYLGLVSDGTVSVAEPDVTGPGDLDVYAAIYAKRQFAVHRYSDGERATLTVYGSVTAGSLTATEPRFRTKLRFDTRLENARPPSFPMTDRYELASWDGIWRPRY